MGQFLTAGGQAEFAIVGPGGEKAFAPIQQQWPAIRYLGSRTPQGIAELLRSSRVLLLPSRWESGPIVIGEALCSGCSIVGTPNVPSVISSSLKDRSARLPPTGHRKPWQQH